MTKNLKALLEESTTIKARADEATRQISKIAVQKDEVVAAATGPDDEKALQKLNVLVSREQIANSQLKISKREIAGMECRLLNESIYVRKEALAALEKERRRLLDRLDANLEEFYPVARDRKQVIEHLTAGAGVIQVPVLVEIGRMLSMPVFNRREQTEIAWAKNIFNCAEQVTAFLSA